jgi:hypothetical protein
MKKIINIFSISIFIIALLFKTLSWPFSDYLFLISLGILLPINYLVELIDSWKNKEHKLVSIFYFTSIFFFLEATIFKLLHWPASELFFYASIFFLTFYFITKGIVSYKQNKHQIYFSLFFLPFIAYQMLSINYLVTTSSMMIVGYLGLTIATIIAFRYYDKTGKIIIELNTKKSITILLVLVLILIAKFQFSVPKSIVANQIESIALLQEENDFEKRTGDYYSKSLNNSQSKKIDLETAKILAEIENRKFELLELGEPDLTSLKLYVYNNQVPTKNKNIDSINLIKLDLLEINNKFDFFIPYDLMIDDNKGKMIKRDAISYFESLINHFETNSISKDNPLVLILKNKIEQMNDFSSNKYDENSWEFRLFASSTLIQAINNLTQLQNDILFYRTLALGELSRSKQN